MARSRMRSPRPRALLAGRPDRAAAVLSLALAGACGAQALPAADQPAQPGFMPLCDGSDRVRLLYRDAGGGLVPRSFTFYAAYGNAFLVIDGRCRYQAGSDYLHGVRAGTLT